MAEMMMMAFCYYRSRVFLLLLAAFSVRPSTFAAAAAAEVAGGDNNDDAPPPKYGVDVSFPIQHNFVSTNYAWLPHNVDPSVPTPPEYEDMPIQPLGDKQKAYDEFLNGCIEHFANKNGEFRCRASERDRIAMSLRQPQSMQNYTKIGYKKIRAPDDLFKLLTNFWNKNKDKGSVEKWGVANTYTNNWKVDSEMISVEDTSLRGGGSKLKKKIWDAAREIIFAWTGQELTECSLYGIRRYKEGAILATHVDRLPLVSSAIINVAQDTDEPWPLEVIGHDGIAQNVTMEPGDMVLYESHSVLHGRPYPLKGRFLANIFIHFEPTGHTIRHNAKEHGPTEDVDQKYRESLARGQGGHENDQDGLPSYILPGSPEETNWRREHPKGAPSQNKQQAFTTGSTPAHQAAQAGDTKELAKLIKADKDLIHARDSNGWTPLMESARSGHVETVRYLVKKGADPNIKSYGTAATALWWAKQEHGPEHPVIEFLESVGATLEGPEL